MQIRSQNNMVSTPYSESTGSLIAQENPLSDGTYQVLAVQEITYGAQDGLVLGKYSTLGTALAVMDEVERAFLLGDLTYHMPSDNTPWIQEKAKKYDSE